MLSTISSKNNCSIIGISLLSAKSWFESWLRFDFSKERGCAPYDHSFKKKSKPVGPPYLLRSKYTKKLGIPWIGHHDFLNNALVSAVPTQLPLKKGLLIFDLFFKSCKKNTLRYYFSLREEEKKNLKFFYSFISATYYQIKNLKTLKHFYTLLFWHSVMHCVCYM